MQACYHDSSQQKSMSESTTSMHPSVTLEGMNSSGDSSEEYEVKTNEKIHSADNEVIDMVQQFVERAAKIEEYPIEQESNHSHQSQRQQSDNSDSCNTVFNPGRKCENIWNQMDISKKRWPVRFFSQFSSHAWDIGLTEEGLVKYSPGRERVFCKFSDIGQIGLGWVANYVTNIHQNRDAVTCRRGICISILLKHKWHDDKLQETRWNLAMCCGKLRREIMSHLLTCLHRKGILPETRSVRRTKKHVKILKDDRKFEIDFNHRRRVSKRYGEYGVKLGQEKYQKLASGLSNEISVNDMDQPGLKRVASKVTIHIVNAFVDRLNEREQAWHGDPSRTSNQPETYVCDRF